MLTSKDLHEEIKNIEDVANRIEDVYEKTSLKVSTLILKLLQSIRTNQVLLLKKMDIELVKPAKSKETEKVEQ